MSTQIGLAKQKVSDWLIGEHDYQFAKNLITHNADPTKSAAYILETEIENKWQRFQVFNRASYNLPEPKLLAQASQQLLKACGGARGALVWEQVALGKTVAKGSEISFQELDAYFQSLHAIDDLPPQQLLEMSLGTALNLGRDRSERAMPSSAPIFKQLAGLTIIYLINQSERSGEMIVPKPGVASGNIII